MTRRRLLTAAMLLGSLAATTATAQPMDGPTMTMMDGPTMTMMHGSTGHAHGIDFAAIDADGNGSLTRAELTARATERLARFDANGDGALDRDEIVAAMPGPRGGLYFLFSADPAEARADRLLAMMGATESGRVEVAALADRRVNDLFVWIDTDRDAAISQEEAEAVQAGREEWMHRHREGMGRDDGPGRDRDRD